MFAVQVVEGKPPEAEGTHGQGVEVSWQCGMWLFSHSVLSNSSRPHGLQHARLPCPSVQYSSVAQSCLTLCDPMNCSMPGHPVHHQLLEFTQTHPLSRWCHPTTSSSVVPFSSCPQSFPASGSFPMSQLLTSGGQSIGVSASTPRADLP